MGAVHCCPTHPAILFTDAALLLLGVLIAALALSFPDIGTRVTGPDGCSALLRRNPITGQDEAMGRSRLSRDGVPRCR